MTIWIIEPHDPLIVRNGRPFSATPGVQAESLPFPFPSTTTGGVRTRAGLKDDIFDIAMTQEVKKIKVRGPLLVQLPNDTSKQLDWLLPTPADVLIFDPKEQKQVFQQLMPLIPFEGALTDYDSEKLQLVGPEKIDPRKPFKDAPHYWYWPKFQEWLLNPANFCKKYISQLMDKNKQFASLGHNGPAREHRTHVSIKLDQRVAKDEALFGTSGLEFTVTEKQNLGEARQLALAVAVDEKEAPGLKEGFAGLGGERRMVSWHKSNSDLPTCPPQIQDTIVENKACRVILLTPAYFKQGYYPTWLTEEHYSVTPKLAAIAIQRPQVASGWQLEKPAGPKPTRRLAPAGTVIYLNNLTGSDDAIREWVNNIWMQCISDNDTQNGNDPDQYRNDGFGLAVLGTWDGQPKAMQ